MRVLLLANATASSVTARTRVLIQTLLNDRYDVQLALTGRRGHAARLARGAAADGIDVVVVLGGDGTLNEAANGLAETRCALAALPGGSTNVFARTIGTHDDPLAATTAICDALDAGRIELVGLGEANPVSKRAAVGPSGGGRLFLFHCGIGFDAAVVKRAERWPKLKRYAAHPLYLASAVATWLRYTERYTPMTVTHVEPTSPTSPGSTSPSSPGSTSTGSTSPTTPDPTTAITSIFTVVLNTDPYTYLGSRPVSLAPMANLRNGLSVVAVRATTTRAALRVLSAALRTNYDLDRLDNSDLHRADDLTDIVVQADIPDTANSAELPGIAHHQIHYQIDGEYLDRVAGLHFRHRPRILPLVIP